MTLTLITLIMPTTHKPKYPNDANDPIEITLMILMILVT